MQWHHWNLVWLKIVLADQLTTHREDDHLGLGEKKVVEPGHQENEWGERKYWAWRRRPGWMETRRRESLQNVAPWPKQRHLFNFIYSFIYLQSWFLSSLSFQSSYLGSPEQTTYENRLDFSVLPETPHVTAQGGEGEIPVFWLHVGCSWQKGWQEGSSGL